MLNEVKSTTLTILNKNNFGSLNVSDFNRLAKLAQVEVFKGYTKDYNDLVNSQNSMKSGEDYADRISSLESNIDNFLVFDQLLSVSGDFLILPSELTTGNILYQMIDLKLYHETTLISTAERVTSRQYNSSLISEIEGATKDFPIYTTNTLRILVKPTTVEIGDGHLWKADYIRMPKSPKWTYVELTGGAPIFDPTADDFQDLEIGQDDFPKIVRLICQYAGLVIRDRDVVTYMSAKDQQEEQKK
jgi:hypothetical protein